MLTAPGDTIESSDFIKKSEQSTDPTDDENRVPKIEADGRLHADFTMPAGIFFPFAGASGDVPAGFLLCDGASYLRTDYPDLFAAIGVLWGAADGTHFNVPNIKGRVVVGFDSGQTEFDTIAETGGEKTHTLTEDEMPSHIHTLYAQMGADGQNRRPETGSGNYSSSGASHSNVDSAGGDDPHNNLQPYTVSHYIIKT